MVVVPDGGGQGEYSLHDAGDDTAGCASSVLFKVELSLEGFVDRLDDLPQRPEQGCFGPFRLAFAGGPLVAAVLVLILMQFYKLKKGWERDQALLGSRAEVVANA